VEFPKAIDYHKPNKPKVPNGLGVLYVLISVIYLFILHFFGVNADQGVSALTLAGCILFGGFLGLLDDWVDLRWRYKAFTPILASLPLITLIVPAQWWTREKWWDPVVWINDPRANMATYIFGKINFGIYYYILIIPIIVAVTTNTVNQLGGLNGLETICPLIVMVGLAIVSPNDRSLLYASIAACLILALFNYKGKIFVGNTGTYALGITIASFSIIANIEQTLLISILPYIFNSSIIILNHFLFHKKADLIMQGDKLYSQHRRSLQTIIAHNRPMSEHRIVQIVSLIVLCSTAAAVLMWLIL
jgi:UDP-N-acetylglucosamine--dolichyl-phosphate N-acetylglucosaminephosphotransferase